MWFKLDGLEHEKEKELDAKIGGGYNDFPEGWRQVDEKYIATHTNFQSYVPEYTGYRQIHYKDEKGKHRLINATLFLFRDGFGIATSFDYWGGKVKWYIFGCEHDYRAMTKDELEKYDKPSFRCLHHYICKKCGHQLSQDSSD